MSGLFAQGGVRRALAVLTAVAAQVCCSDAQALQMALHRFDDGSEALIVRDCESTPQHQCEKHETQFSAGDSARLEAMLSRRGYSEVLLISGGGSLDEGVKVGEVLRKYGMAVRVPSGHRCISACTVAFLGGVIRTVDEGASYEVHAYSGVRSALGDEERALIVSYPEQALASRAMRERQSARRWAARLLAYAQRMVGGRPDLGAIEVALAVESSLVPRYVSNGKMARDVSRVRLEGAAAAHTAVMAIERDAMEEAIEQLRTRVSTLGPRAGHAINILNTMFSSDITRTFKLTREVLLQMGYITPFVRR